MKADKLIATTLVTTGLIVGTGIVDDLFFAPQAHAQWCNDGTYSHSGDCDAHEGDLGGPIVQPCGLIQLATHDPCWGLPTRLLRSSSRDSNCPRQQCAAIQCDRQTNRSLMPCRPSQARRPNRTLHVRRSRPGMVARCLSGTRWPRYRYNPLPSTTRMDPLTGDTLSASVRSTISASTTA